MLTEISGNGPFGYQNEAKVQAGKKKKKTLRRQEVGGNKK